MMAWWRAYDEAADDPKLQRLSGDLFKTWFNLICLASRNGGVLPPLADLAFGLRRSEKDVRRALDALIAERLFDVTGNGIEPHNWNARQYKSDVSTSRVRSFRKRQRERQTERDETVSGNAPEQSRAEEGKAPLGLSPDSDVDEPRSSSARGSLQGSAHGAESVQDMIAVLTGKIRHAS